MRPYMQNERATEVTPLDGGSACRPITTASNDTQSPPPAQCAWCRMEYEQVKGFGVFCSEPCARAESRSDGGPALRSAFQVEQARRKASEVMCTCKHMEKAHGSHSGSCLQKIGGRFDGASDQTRCRCKRFVAARESTPDASPDTLANDLLQSLVRAQGKKILEQGAAIVELERKVRDLAHMVGP